MGQSGSSAQWKYIAAHANIKKKKEIESVA